jgi:hypothetical protein
MLKKLRRVLLLSTAIAVVLHAGAANQLCTIDPLAEACASIASGPKTTGSGPQPRPLIPEHQTVSGTVGPSAGTVSLSGRITISARGGGFLS